jgi:hypothetical protein
MPETTRLLTGGHGSAGRGPDAAPSRFDEQVARLDDVVGVRADGLAPPPTRVDGPDTTSGPIRGDDAAAPPVREDAPAPPVRDDASAPPVREDAGGAGHADDAPAADQPGRADDDAGTGGSGGDDGPVQPAPVKDAPTGPITDTTGRPFTDVIDRSAMTRNQLADYLDAVDPNAGAVFREKGTWPADQQVPSDASVLGPDGKVNWRDEAPHDGFTSNDDGHPIKTPDPDIPLGTRLDREGPETGRFTSPLNADGTHAAHGTRALPWVENDVRTYEVVGDLRDIRGAYDASTDTKLKLQIDATMKLYKLDWNDIRVFAGEIDEAFGEVGGGTQYQLPFGADVMVDLGLLKRVAN